VLRCLPIGDSKRFSAPGRCDPTYYRRLLIAQQAWSDWTVLSALAAWLITVIR
jgi:hypothetical protein